MEGIRWDVAPMLQADRNGKLSILLVDDEPFIRSLLADALMYQGYQVYEAEDGATGLEQFCAIQPDLVLLDILMPGLNGLAVLQEIRRQNPVVGILVVSALSSKQVTLEAMAAGADGYIRKPFDLRELFRKIESLDRRVCFRSTELHPV